MSQNYHSRLSCEDYHRLCAAEKNNFKQLCKWIKNRNVIRAYINIPEELQKDRWEWYNLWWTGMSGKIGKRVIKPYHEADGIMTLEEIRNNSEMIIIFDIIRNAPQNNFTVKLQDIKTIIYTIYITDDSILFPIIDSFTFLPTLEMYSNKQKKIVKDSYKFLFE